MPSFDIADCPTSLTLVAPPGDTTGKTSATLALTIRNVTDRRRTGRVMIEPSATAKPDWFALDGSPTSPLEEQIDFEPRATRTVQATVTVPPGTPGGAHTLRVRVTAEQDPDNDFVQSGTVAMTVPAPPAVVQPPPKTFPWWIPVAAGGAVVAVVVTVLYMHPWGPTTPRDACKPGFMWREATPGDHVCVTPATKRQVQADNAAANSRVQPGGGPYGPKTCIQGFVWRESSANDLVCVVPEIRTQARSDNSETAARQLKP